MPMYRYEKGQHFTMHRDQTFMLPNAKERTLFSFMIYLNDDFEGGHTTFFKEDDDDDDDSDEGNVTKGEDDKEEGEESSSQKGPQRKQTSKQKNQRQKKQQLKQRGQPNNNNKRGGEGKRKAKGRGNKPSVAYAVVPETGSCLVFDHYLLHEGSDVQKGIKYAVRSDVFYTPITE